jgi:hypothetical protein
MPQSLLCGALGFARPACHIVFAFLILLAALLADGTVTRTLAQTTGDGATTATERVTNPPPKSGDAVTGEGVQATATLQGGPKVYLTYKTPFEFHLTILTIVLAIFMAIVLSVMGWKSGINEEFVRSFMVVMIVFAALFLVVAGYSDQQTAPVFGLLGTIAGYIFGRTQRPLGATAGTGPEQAAADGAPTPAGR